MKGRREALAKFCLLIQIMHQRPEYSPKKLLEPYAVLPVGANGRSDGEPGDAVSAMGGNGRSDGEWGGVLQHVAGRGGVQQHVVVRGGVLQHAGWGSDGTEYFSSEKEYNFYSEK